MKKGDFYSVSYKESKLMMEAQAPEMKEFLEILYETDTHKQIARTVAYHLYELELLKPTAIIRPLVATVLSMFLKVGPGKKLDHFQKCLKEWQALPQNQCLQPAGQETVSEIFVRMFLNAALNYDHNPNLGEPCRKIRSIKANPNPSLFIPLRAREERDVSKAQDFAKRLVLSAWNTIS